MRGEETKSGFLCIDHDEMKGRWAVRGLLCTTCNTSLGFEYFARYETSQQYLANPFRAEKPAGVRSRRRPSAGVRPISVARYIRDSVTSMDPESKDALYKLSRRYVRSMNAFEAVRDQLFLLVEEALEAGVSQSDITWVTGLPRSKIREIAWEARRKAAAQTEVSEPTDAEPTTHTPQSDADMANARRIANP